MWPVHRWQTFETTVECSSEKPINCPKRDCQFHLGSFWSFCNLASSTYTGHPQTWETPQVPSDFVLVSISIGVIPELWFGTRLYTHTECLTAKDQRERSSTSLSVQCNDECIINVWAMNIMVWIACSARSFWCWAPTPDKLWVWPLFLKWLRYSFSKNTPLPLW